MTQTTSGFMTIDSGTLYYESAGSGEPLVLSHAAFLDSRMFDAQWDVLARHFRVIRYDMIGYGRSSAAQGPVCRRHDLRQLLDGLAISQAHLVGCSNGGTILLDLALERPHLALSLTMVGSEPSGFEMQGEPPRYVMEMFAATQQGDTDRASELQIRIWLDGMYREPHEMDATLREKALMMNRIPVERRTFLTADMQPVNPLTPPAVQRLQDIAWPMLAVAGSLEHPEILRAADVMAARIPQARKMIIEGTAHVPSYEKPDAFNDLLLEFLRVKQL